jgi:hypothetical protein
MSVELVEKENFSLEVSLIPTSTTALHSALRPHSSNCVFNLQCSCHPDPHPLFHSIASSNNLSSLISHLVVVSPCCQFRFCLRSQQDHQQVEPHHYLQQRYRLKLWIRLNEFRHLWQQDKQLAWPKMRNAKVMISIMNVWPFPSTGWLPSQTLFQAVCLHQHVWDDHGVDDVLLRWKSRAPHATSQPVSKKKYILPPFLLPSSAYIHCRPLDPYP